MTNKVQYHVNKSQGEEHELPCLSCAGKTWHKVVVSYDEAGNHELDAFYWKTEYQIVQCQGCRVVSFRQATSNSEDYYQVGEDEWEHGITESLFPSRFLGRRGLGADTKYLPSDIRQIYDETSTALESQSQILAGIGLRALLERVCKAKNSTGRDLYQRIDSLVEAKVLTPASAKILHRIRTLGNEAAHEAKPHTHKQLGIAMDIIEHLLKDVYILPQQVESEFSTMAISGE